MKRILLTMLMLVAAASVLIAQESIETDEKALFGTTEGEDAVVGSDEESLFGGGELIGEVEENEENLGTALLTSDTVEIGGRFRFDASCSWNFDGPAGPFGAELLADSLDLDFGALIFLDARPSETFRVYGEVDIAYPFEDQVQVSELFSDFQFGDALFFRAGKQTINWGVGYFFSPADLLNVTEIDPEDPEAELEGPVALKIQAPVGASNLYLYTVFEDAASIDKVALAPKAEFVIGGTEIGLGAFYRAGDAPAAMATLTTSLLNISIFAEGLVTYDERLIPSGTAGLSSRFADDLDLFSISVSSQYLYNGEGTDNQSHYGAASVSWSGMIGSDFTLGCLWLGNLSDGSGMIAPSLSWELIEDLDLTLKASFMYGDAGDAYTPTPAGDTMTLSVSAGFGGGSF